MTLKKVNELPKPKRKAMYTHLFSLLDTFMNSSDKLVQVVDEHGEYASSQSMYNAIYNAVKLYRYPAEVNMRNGEVYIRKTL